MSVKSLKAKDVAEKVLFGELFILDVRNEKDYEDWKIEGKQVSSINKPYFDLLDGVEHIVSELPKDKDIFHICITLLFQHVASYITTVTSSANNINLFRLI